MPCTIVIKIGTSSIIDETTHTVRYSLLEGIATTIASLREDGFRVILVSSGAVGFGLMRLDLASRPDSLSCKQALAAVGQAQMMSAWVNVFAEKGMTAAQVLLTQGDISCPQRYENAVRTFHRLLSFGVVPIVNENDTLSTEGLKIGDNDTLGAITAAMNRASYLFLLTDVEALYASNPKYNANASRIDLVNSIGSLKNHIDSSNLGAGSANGTGGMATKLRAAEMASDAGIFTVITSSSRPSVVNEILEYYTEQRMDKLASAISDSFMTDADSSDEEDARVRPHHTLFMPSPPQSATSESPRGYLVPSLVF
ncbi:Glutamate 5-kinase [Gnomoniopsis sp. IMI 355080]|nr:Glutamate 5-kinase [Gnomoniopsis sp. IMI 355080]